MPDYYVYRPRSNWAYLSIVVLIGILSISSFLYAGMVQAAILSFVNFTAFGVLFWIFIVGPKVVYTKTGIEIHNPLRTIKIGWLKTSEFVTKYAFTVLTETSSYSAWAAPAASRFNTRKMHTSDFRGTGLESRKLISPSDSPRAESGVAMILALKHRDFAIAQGTASDTKEVKINYISLVLTVVATITLLSNFVR